MRASRKTRFEKPGGPITVIESESFQMSSSAVNLPTSSANEQQNAEPSSGRTQSSEIPIDLLGINYTHSANIPQFQSFSGKCEFCFDVPEEKSDPECVKDLPLIYSRSRNKLYVKRDHLFRIIFFTSTDVPNGTKIRAMGMFIERDYASEVVKRCDEHTIVDYQNGVRNPDHLLRCESDQVLYVRDPNSDRRSLLVPYENPQDRNCCSHLFKFVCNGGCYGGLNGRQFRVIFTLESGKNILGRRSIEVKISKDPRKDCDRDDKRAALLEERVEPRTENNGSRKRPAENSHFFDIMEWMNKLRSSSDLKSDEEEPNGSFWQLEVPDQEAYELLVYARQAYKISKALEKYSPYIMKYLSDVKKKKK